MSDNLQLSDIALFMDICQIAGGRNPPGPPPMTDETLPAPPIADDLAHLAPLAETARTYARSAKAENTQHAYAADWRHYTAWCMRRGVAPLPPNPQAIGLYIADLAVGSGRAGRNPATIARRLSGLAWMFRQRGAPLDRADPHIKEVLAGIRRQHGRPPQQKEALTAEDVLAMAETLGRADLRALRDRAILLLGFAGGLRRSELVGLDLGRDHTQEGRGWIEMLEAGVVLHIKGKTGWREVEVGKGSADLSCPVVALATWIRLGRVDHGPVFRRVSRDGKRALLERLTDRHVARLVQATAMAAGVRGDLPEGERKTLFAGHSLRAGLATSAEVEERYVQKQLGHASAEMTRRYQRRRDRFRVNLTKAAGL